VEKEGWGGHGPKTGQSAIEEEVYLFSLNDVKYLGTNLPFNKLSSKSAEIQYCNKRLP
jgi:hypothetical protein